MSISYVGKVAEYFVGASAPAANTFSPTTAIPVGQFLVLVARGGGGYVVTSVTDSSSNTWTQLANNGGTGNTCTVYYCYVTTALTTSSTITANYTAGNINYNVMVLAFSGICRPTTTSATATGTSVLTLNTGNITPSQYGSLLLSAFTHNGSPTSINAPSGFTTVTPSANARMVVGYTVAASMAAVGTTWSWTTSANVAEVSGTFTPDGGDFLALF